MSSLSSAENKYFLNKQELIQLVLLVGGVSLSDDDLCLLQSSRLLITFWRDNQEYFLREDITVLIPWIQAPILSNSLRQIKKHSLFEFNENIRLQLGVHTFVDINTQPKSSNPSFFAAIKNLIRYGALNLSDTEITDCETIPYFDHAEIYTNSYGIKEFVVQQKLRDTLTRVESIGQFARSASYMGSKKSLVPFLIEALSNVLPPEGMVVDLMCGSGIAASSFARIWPTIASDAQAFCRILAVVQGGGYTLSRAQKLLPQIILDSKENFKLLQNKLSSYIQNEDRIFHGGVDDIITEYQDFIKSYFLFPESNAGGNWDPYSEVSIRRENPFLFPYLLFTAYFANVYFGVRQCLEIDSLRYAIDKIKDPHDREWALGSLVATVSLNGTTYGGHFAQPPVKSVSDINDNNCYKIIEKRNKSITQDFRIRFLSLATESERNKYSISKQEGPWQKAITDISLTVVPGRPLLVYLDAPYTREEYSRYYHLLETLVNYNYPSSVGLGKIPDKAKGERFKSEFFTREQDTINLIFIRIISTIVDKGWYCAWSYSDSGTACMCSVIEGVKNISRCNVITYCAPHSYKSQGGHGSRSKKVGEYLIIFKKDMYA